MKKIIYSILFGTVVLGNLAFAQSENQTADTSNYCPSISSNLRRGSSGNEVKELQKFLKDYYDLSDDNFIVSGTFGRLTQKYVMQFQGEQGLVQSGMVGAMTKGKIVRVCSGLSVQSNQRENIYMTPSKDFSLHYGNDFIFENYQGVPDSSFTNLGSLKYVGVVGKADQVNGSIEITQYNNKTDLNSCKTFSIGPDGSSPSSETRNVNGNNLFYKSIPDVAMGHEYKRDSYRLFTNSGKCLEVALMVDYYARDITGSYTRNIHDADTKVKNVLMGVLNTLQVQNSNQAGAGVNTGSTPNISRNYALGDFDTVYDDFNFDGLQDKIVVANKYNFSDTYRGAYPHKDIYVQTTSGNYILSSELTSLVNGTGWFTILHNNLGNRILTYASGGATVQYGSVYEIIPNRGLRLDFKITEETGMDVPSGKIKVTTENIDLLKSVTETAYTKNIKYYDVGSYITWDKVGATERKVLGY